MKNLHIFLILSSLNVLLVTMERFSFTTKIVLQPYDFLRLHEGIQMTIIILITMILPFFMMKTISNNFKTISTKKETTTLLIFIIGVYFYATGNGAHEIASYIFNTFCDTKTIPSSGMCASAFFNDYYFGNILYFAGGLLMYFALMMFERTHNLFLMNRKDMWGIVSNAMVLAIAIFAYAAFDPVLVGVVYSIAMMVMAWIFLYTSGRDFRRMPLTFYTTVAYSIGSILSLAFRFG